MGAFLLTPNHVLPFAKELDFGVMGFAYKFDWNGGYVFKAYQNEFVYELHLSLQKTEGCAELNLLDEVEICRDLVKLITDDDHRALIVRTRKDLVLTLAKWGLVAALPLAREYKITTLLDNHATQEETT